jgi:hypothetical protein
MTEKICTFAESHVKKKSVSVGTPPRYSVKAASTICSNAFRTQEWSNLEREDVSCLRKTPPLVSFLVAWSLQPWRWKQYASPKRWLLAASPHGAQTQKNIINVAPLFSVFCSSSFTKVVLPLYIICDDEIAERNASHSNYAPVSITGVGRRIKELRAHVLFMRNENYTQSCGMLVPVCIMQVPVFGSQSTAISVSSNNFSSFFSLTP